MSSEIDRLEIVIETQANKANRALTALEKRLGKIAGSIEKISAISSSLDNFGNIDTKALDSVQKEIDSITKKISRTGNKKISAKVDKSDINATKNDLDSLFKKFQDAGKGIDLSEMGLTELQSGLKKAESDLNRFYDRFDKKLAIEGTDDIGKSWENLIYDIQKATNQVELYSNAISEVSKKVPKFTIEKGVQKSVSSTGPPKTSSVDAESLFYDQDAMHMVFGEYAKELRSFDDVMKKFGGNSAKASRAINEFEEKLNVNKVNTYEAQIKRLRSELAKLANQGFKQGDLKYDDKAREIAKVAAQQKRYNKEIRDSANTRFTSVPDSGIEVSRFKKSSSEIKKIIDSTKKLGKSVSSEFGRATKLIDRFKNAISGAQKQSNKGMSFGRMVGSSVAFSFVFQGVSMIQNAIKEGSDNLTQYSSEYNHSISSMVSALLYLKNAWAVAFAPIMNVVAPYIQSFVNMLANALNAVGRFFSALTGKGFAVQAKKVWKDYGASIQKETGKAKDSVKELKNTILGFDQLHVLNDPSSDNGKNGSDDGAGELSPSDMFNTVKTEGVISEYARKLREAFLSEDWEGLGRILADGVNAGLQKVYDALNWSNVGPQITYFCNAFTTTMNSLVSNIDWDLMGRTVGAGVNTIVNTLNLLITGFDWKNLGSSFSKGINGFVKEVDWNNLGNLIGNYFMISWDVFAGLVSELDYEEIGLAIANGINGLLQTMDFGTIASSLSTFAIGMLQTLGVAISELDWQAVGQQIVDAIASIDWGGLASGLFNVGLQLIYGLLKAFGELPAPVQIAAGAVAIFFGAFKVTEAISSLVNFGKSISGVIKSAGGLVNLFGGPVTLAIMAAIAIGALLIANWDEISAAAEKAWKFVTQKFKEFDDFLKNIFQKDWTESFGALGHVLNGFFEGVEDIWNSIKRIFGGIIDFVAGVFTGDWERAWNGIKDIFGGIWDAIASLVKTPVNTIIGVINSLIKGVVSGINGVIKALNKLSFKIPSWVPEFGGKKFGFNIPKVSAPQIPYLAKGGFPGMGQLFVANERGPEMIGRMGRKNVVANNMQITEGIKSAVVDGLMEVFMSTGGIGESSEPPIIEFTYMVDSETQYKTVLKGKEKHDRRYSAVVRA